MSKSVDDLSVDMRLWRLYHHEVHVVSACEGILQKRAKACAGRFFLLHALVQSFLKFLILTGLCVALYSIESVTQAFVERVLCSRYCSVSPTLRTDINQQKVRPACFVFVRLITVNPLGSFKVRPHRKCLLQLKG